MIGRLSGTIAEELDGMLLVNVRGVGYEVLAPLGTLGRATANERGEQTLYIHTHVREDALLLFGFASDADRFAFRQLISVSGVGPKTAVSVLSALPAPELGLAIQRKELGKLTAISGIGKKTAERLLLELEDKIPTGTGEASLAKLVSRNKGAHSGNAALVANALVGMGYKQAEADRALASLDAELLNDADLSKVLREALATLVKK
jgi:holliday junction DNA helicase RuvA